MTSVAVRACLQGKLMGLLVVRPCYLFLWCCGILLRGLCHRQLSGKTVQHLHCCGMLILEGLEVLRDPVGERSNVILDL